MRAAKKTKVEASVEAYFEKLAKQGITGKKLLKIKCCVLGNAEVA